MTLLVKELCVRFRFKPFLRVTLVFGPRYPESLSVLSVIALSMPGTLHYCAIVPFQPRGIDADKWPCFALQPLERVDVVDGPSKSTHKSAVAKAREEADGETFGNADECQCDLAVSRTKFILVSYKKIKNNKIKFFDSQRSSSRKVCRPLRK